jgi:hypothetical protein
VGVVVTVVVEAAVATVVVEAAVATVAVTAKYNYLFLEKLRQISSCNANVDSFFE